MIQVQDSKSNTVWSTSLFLCIILRYFPYCKYTSQYSKSKWSHITIMLRFYINICKWRTYKLIYDHGEDWKLFIAIELVQTIFLGWFQMLAPSNYPLEFHPNKSYYPGPGSLLKLWSNCIHFLPDNFASTFISNMLLETFKRGDYRLSTYTAKWARRL